MSYIVGVTGGIGSGKTTITLKFQQQYQIDIIDADLVARDVVNPNTPALDAITKHFGMHILLSSGELNRSRLRQCIFEDPKERAWLNQLLHPLIRQEIQFQLMQTQSPYTLLVIPLLIENHWQDIIDTLLVIDVSVKTQIERTQIRDKISKEQILAILSSQASRQERLDAADDVINNELSPIELDYQIHQLHKKYIEQTK